MNKRPRTIMKTTVLDNIKAYETAMSGCNVDYVITDEIELKDGATLYLFKSEEDGIYSSAVGYEDGSVFVLTDWQGARPETADDVESYDWCRVDGTPAIVFFGLPRVLE